MAKIAVKKDKAPPGKEKNPKKKKQKKKFWKHPPKISNKPAKSKKKVSLLLPPKNPQEFSSNWKALQELLKSEKSRATQEPSAAESAAKEERVESKDKQKRDAHSKKQPPHINGGVKEGPSAERKPKNTAGDAVAATHKANEKKRKRSADEEEKHSKNKKAEPNPPPETPKIDLWFDDVDPDDIEAALGAEAGQIARKMQGLPEKKANAVDVVLVKDRAFEGLTRTVAMDCEMVGVGKDGEESILARVSIVNQFGKCVYDKFVRPTERVTDYRTEVSGIRPQDIKNGEPFQVVQKEVSEILQGRILVGHALHNDLKILFLDHPKKAIRDTQKYKPFKQKVKSGRPSLKLLCEKILSVKVQTGEHCSIQDSQAAMRLYTMEKRNWEAAIKAKYNKNKAEPQKGTAASPQ